MLDKEPLWFPSRNSLPFSPGVTDRQLWALGMIVVQWSMTEWFIESNARKLIGDDKDVLAQFERNRNFQQRLEFWKTQTELRQQEPPRSQLLALVSRIQALNSQRDEVIHRMWGGGVEEIPNWAAGSEDIVSTDGGMMPNPGEKLPNNSGLVPFSWRATFPRLKRMAIEMATLNRDLMVLLMLLQGTPHGNIDAGGQVSPG